MFGRDCYTVLDWWGSLSAAHQGWEKLWVQVIEYQASAEVSQTEGGWHIDARKLAADGKWVGISQVVSPFLNTSTPKIACLLRFVVLYIYKCTPSGCKNYSPSSA